MKLLYSDMLPLGAKEGQATIIDAMMEQFKNADRVEIAVGYISSASLIELEKLVSQFGIRRICLNIYLNT